MNSLKFKNIMQDKSGVTDDIFKNDPVYLYQ